MLKAVNKLWIKIYSGMHCQFFLLSFRIQIFSNRKKWIFPLSLNFNRWIIININNNKQWMISLGFLMSYLEFWVWCVCIYVFLLLVWFSLHRTLNVHQLIRKRNWLRFTTEFLLHAAYSTPNTPLHIFCYFCSASTWSQWIKMTREKILLHTNETKLISIASTSLEICSSSVTIYRNV